MAIDRHYEVLRELVSRQAETVGVSVPDLSMTEIRTIGRQDMFGGELEIDGLPVDSLALTETLVGAEEELEVDLFDDDRADEVRTLLEVVDLALERLPPETIDLWLTQQTPDRSLWRR